MMIPSLNFWIADYPVWALDRKRLAPVVLSFFLLLTLAGGISAQQTAQILRAPAFPLMQKLQRGDSLFDQINADMTAYYKARSRKSPLPPLNLVRYVVKDSENLYSIAARLNMPHSSLASLNHIGNPSQVQPKRELIVPNLPGIYLSLNPRTQLEQLLFNRLGERLDQGETIRFQVDDRVEEFRYFPSEDFSPRERLAFLGSLFRSPLASYRISSDFGPRRNPISGQLIHHDGIDMVAPAGTPVLAAGDGTVLETGYDPVYGNFLIIDHSGGYESVYAHLRRSLVQKGKTVAAGDPVAYVGNTGQTTGTHLHFEIHFNGSPKDPAKLINK